MGVTGLWDTIRDTGESKTLQAYLAKKKAALKRDHDGSPIVIGVDVRPCMAECVAAASSPTVSGQLPGGELYIFFIKLATYFQSSATYLFVLDGPGRPGVKRGTKVVDREPRWTKQVKELIRCFGYHIHQAPGEAEAELSMLNRMGLIDGIITSDGDTFVFGGLSLLRTIPHHKKKYDDEFVLFTSDALEAIGLTHGGLILFALICGGDYDGGIAGCGAATAHGLARCGLGDQLIKAVNMLSGGELLEFLKEWRSRIRSELTDNHSKFLTQRQPHIASLVTDAFPDLQILDLYCRPFTSWSEPAQNIPDGRSWIVREPDLHRLSVFCSTKFEWDDEAALKLNFARKGIWSGAFLQMLYSNYMMYDHNRKLFSTPTMQAEITKLSFVVRRGEFLDIAGPEPQPMLHVSAENFVKLMSGNFTSAPTDVVTVWPPKELLPDILQITSSSFSAKSRKRTKKATQTKEGSERSSKKKAHTPVDQERPPKRRPRTESSRAMGDLQENTYAPVPLIWLGYHDWTDLDDGDVAESSSSAARRLDRERTAKKISDATTEVIDLTTSD